MFDNANTAIVLKSAIRPYIYMAFKGKHLVRSKIEIDGSILEQVKQFNCLGCELSLDGEPDFDKK